MTRLQERFWAKVEMAGEDACWLWTASTNEHGYGVIRPHGRRSGPTLKAHRLSAEWAGMDVSAGRVLHSCDNPRCVNPRHLRVGTMQDNADDMVNRGRVAWGERRPQAKLTLNAVLSARDRLAKGAQLADLSTELVRDFGVTKMVAYKAITGRTWKQAGAVCPPVARDVINAIREAA